MQVRANGEGEAADAAALARQYFEAVGRGDRACLMQLLDEQVVYRFPGRSTYARDYVGKAAVMAYLERLASETGGQLSVKVLDVLGGTAYAAGVVEATATRKGRTLTWSLIGLIEAAAGRIVRITLYYRDQYGIDDFLGGAVPVAGPTGGHAAESGR